MNLNSLIVIFRVVHILRIKYARIAVVQILKKMYFSTSLLIYILSHGESLGSVHEVVTVLIGQDHCIVAWK